MLCLLAVASVPFARGDDSFQAVHIRLTGIAFLALVAALVRGWSPLVAPAVALAGGAYAVELAVDDAPLDSATPAVAVGLLLAAELSYWSLDERIRTQGDAGLGLRRAAIVALGGVAALVVTAALLALVDTVQARGFAVDLVGILAAAGVLATVAAVALRQSSRGS